MAKTRAQKESQVQGVVDKLKNAKSIVFADLSRLKVNDLTKLRIEA